MIDHWQGLADFARYEILAGGPDPHMRYVGWCARNEPWEERVWRCGVYAAGVYNFASAEAIWLHWPWRKASADPEGLAVWLAANWKGLRLRRERRAIRTPVKLAATFASFVSWASALPSLIRDLPDDPATAYEEMWASLDRLSGVGRYSGFKLLEALRRYADLPARLPDVRPNGGFSPRLTLAALYPDAAEAIGPYRNDRASCETSNRYFADALIRIADLGVDLDPFGMLVVLCEYHQSYDGLRQYPGRANDSEIEYWAAIAETWAGLFDTEMWDARRALTPPWALGEVTGAWFGARNDLGPVFSAHGYTWTDSLYDYGATTDLAEPARRTDAQGAQPGPPRNPA